MSSHKGYQACNTDETCFQFSQLSSTIQINIQYISQNVALMKKMVDQIDSYKELKEFQENL